MGKHPHYVILKQVICDIIDSYCTEQLPYTSRLAPDCKNCREYQDWLKKQKQEET